MSTAVNDEAKAKAKQIAQTVLMPPYKNGVITKDQFKEINKQTAEAAHNGHLPWNDEFETNCRAFMNKKVEEITAAAANGHAANSNGHAMQVEPAAAPQPAPPPPPPHLLEHGAEEAAGAPQHDRRGLVRPRDDTEEGEVAEPPAQRQQLQNNLAPLDRTTVNLADLPPGGIDGVPAPTTIMEFARRPGYGTICEEVKKVKVNCTKIRVPAGLSIHQFDLRFDWIEDGGGGVSGGKGGIPDTESQAMFERLGKLFGGGGVAYDSKKIVYAPGGLPQQLTAEAEAAGWSVSGPGSVQLLFHAEKIRMIDADMLKPENAGRLEQLQANKAELQTKTVTLRAAQGDSPDGVVLDMSRLVNGEDLGSAFRKYMAALDVMLRPFKRYKQVRGAFYDETEQATWAAVTKLTSAPGVDLWHGYRQSVVDTTNGPMLFIDTAVAVMHAPVNLAEFIAHKLGRGGVRWLKLADVKGAERHIITMMGGKRPKIKCAHSSRQYRLAGIDSVPADQAMFFDDEVGREVSVAEFFERKYKMRLQLPQLPCVCVGKKDDPSKVKLPIELCEMVGGEPAQATKRVTEEMNEHAVVAPFKRLGAVDKVLRAKVGSDREVCAAPAFGVEVDPSITEISARRLPSMRLSYMANAGRDNQFEHQVEVAKEGNWKLMGPGGDLGFMEPGEAVEDWVAISFADELPPRVFQNFVHMLQNMAKKRGMRLGNCRPIIDIRPNNISGGGNFSIRVAEEMERKIHDIDRIGLVLCALPSDTTKLYPALKKWSETKTGIPLQCVRADKLIGDKQKGKRGAPLATSPQYHAGVLLKLNLKLAGGNVHGDGLKLMNEKPTMVCGVDVYHPPPGSKEPSWCALVASMDKDCSKFHTVVDMQAQGSGGKDRQEVIPKLREHFLDCLQVFFGKHGHPPQRIIFYRDGVAHNQFEVVGTQEIGEISKVLQEQGLAGMTELIFIVAQKKTNVRFGMVTGGRLDNVPSGTVVDRDVTDRRSFDFYLVSQHALKGTARPTHFHVLTCPPWLTADQIQQFTFDLCHVYARCTKVASRPAPIYYAHLAAAHAPYYDKIYKDRTADFWETASNSSGGSGSTSKSKSDFAQLHPRQRDRLYYC